MTTPDVASNARQAPERTAVVGLPGANPCYHAAVQVIASCTHTAAAVSDMAATERGTAFIRTLAKAVAAARGAEPATSGAALVNVRRA